MTMIHRQTLAALAATAAMSLCSPAATAYEGFDSNADPTLVTEATVKAQQAIAPVANAAAGARQVGAATARSHNTKKTLHSHRTAVEAHPIAGTD